MKSGKRTLFLVMMLCFTLLATVAAAGDFDWTRDFNLRAEADRDGFRARLSARFNIGPAQVKVVLGNVDSPADAYMVLRLGEMSSKPVDYVMKRYRAEKNRGWGALAKSLGIKPGSREFHALKQGSDMYGNTQSVKHIKRKRGGGKK